MISIQGAEEGKVVYFLHDLTEYGGKRIIIKSTISRIEGNWILLTSGYHHRVKDLFFDLKLIPDSENLKLKEIIKPIN